MSKAHAKLSASSSERWMNCSGSIALIDKAPPPRESPYAAEGTKAHEYMEKALKGEMQRHEAIDVYGKEIVEAVDYMEGAVADRMTGFETLLVEEKVQFPLKDHEGNEMFGTVDCAIVDVGTKISVIDYKHGQGIAVEAEKNLQMIYYAIAICEKFKWNFKEVELVIVQPRAFHPESVIRSWTLSIDELKSYVVLFKKGIERVKSGGRLYAGDHCKFCPASVICPEQTTRSLEKANIAFSEPLEAMVPKLPDPKDLTPEQISTLLKKSSALEAFVKSVEEYAEDYLKRGHDIPGFKLVNKRGQRVWGDEAKLESDIRKNKLGGCYTEPKLLSPAQMEKVTGKEFVEKHAVLVSSGVTIAPESDKRPAVNLIEKAFGDENQIETKESENANGKSESKEKSKARKKSGAEKIGKGETKEKSRTKKTSVKKENVEAHDYGF